MMKFDSDACLLTGEKNYFFGLNARIIEDFDEFVVSIQLLDKEGNPLSLDGFKSHLLIQFPEESDWVESEVLDMFQDGIVLSLKGELSHTN